MTLSELPKQLQLVQSVAELQLGIPLKRYVMEVISTRTLKRKMIHDVQPTPNQYGGIVAAPSGYRISRLWKERVAVDTEVAI